MRRSEGDADALADMLERIADARSDTQAGESALDSATTLRSVLYSLAIIGAAANRISQDLREGSPAVPWRQIIAMRNILIHGYDHVRRDLVWDAVRELPALEDSVRAILAGLES